MGSTQRNTAFWLGNQWEMTKSITISILWCWCWKWQKWESEAHRILIPDGLKAVWLIVVPKAEEQVVLENKWSLNPFQAIILSDLHGIAFPIIPTQTLWSPYLKPKWICSWVLHFIFKLEYLKSWIYVSIYSWFPLYSFSLGLICFIFFYLSFLDLFWTNPTFVVYVFPFCKLLC